MRRAAVYLAVCICVPLKVTSLHAALPLSEVLDQMDQRQRTIEDVSFQFVERLTRGHLPEERIAGKVWVQKPQALRVDQTAPQKQTLFSDGVTFRLYTPALKQQIKGNWKAWVKQSHFPLPLIDFVGTLSPERWRDHYKVYFGGYEAPNYKLNFKPLRASELPLTLWVSEQTFLPVRGELIDNAVKVQIELTDMQLNTKPDPSLFTLKTPAGTEEIPVSF